MPNEEGKFIQMPANYEYAYEFMLYKTQLRSGQILVATFNHGGQETHMNVSELADFAIAKRCADNREAMVIMAVDARVAPFLNSGRELE